MTAPGRPWRWIPTLYFPQALPNVAVTTLFFAWVCVATLHSFGVAASLKIDPAFGRRDDNPGS